MLGQLCLAHSLPGERHFLGHRLAVDVLIVVMVGLETEQPVLANLHDPLRAGVEADHQRPRQCLDVTRHLDARHNRDVPGLHTAVGEINRGRRLRGARHADEHHIGFLEAFEVLAVIVQHRVVERVNTLEIVGVERVLRTDAMRELGSEIGLQQLQHRPQDREARQAQFTAVLLKPLQQFVIKQGVEISRSRDGTPGGRPWWGRGPAR